MDSGHPLKYNLCLLSMSSLLSKAPFRFLTDPAIWDLLAVETSGSLPEHFIGLPVIEIQFNSEILPKLIALHISFQRLCCTSSRQDIRDLMYLSRWTATEAVLVYSRASQGRTASAKKSRLCSEAKPGYSLCTNSIFHLVLPACRRVAFLPLAPHRAVHIHIPEQRMSLQLLWTAATSPLRPMRSPESGISRNRQCPPGPPTLFVRSS